MKASNLSQCALYGAVILLITMYLAFPVGQVGFINLGSVAIFITSLKLTRTQTGLVAAVFSMMADILLGYAYFALFTFIIKGIEGYIYVVIARKHVYLGLLIASVWVVFSYFIATTILTDMGIGLSSIGLNMIQVLSCSVIAAILKHSSVFKGKPFNAA